MKKISVGMAGALAAAALIVPAGASAAYPGNLADGCAVGGPQGTSCSWTADVAGSYAAGASGGFTVTESTCTIVNGVATPGTPTLVASGPAGAGTPGQLKPGKDGCGNAEVYTLTISGNGGGAIGSVTGGAGPV